MIELLNRQESNHYEEVAEAIGQIHDVGAVGPLIQSLTNADSYTQRGAAIALGRLGDSRAVEPLISVLQTSNELGVIGLAAEALGLLGDKRALPALRQAIGRGSYSTQDSVQAAIQKIESGRKLPPFKEVYAEYPADALKVLFTQALAAIPACAEEFIKADYKGCQRAWNCRQLHKGSENEIHDLVSSALRRFGVMTGFDEFQISADTRTGYAQVNAFVNNTMVPVRVWKAHGSFIYMCVHALGE